jgi:transposase-like protein
MDRGSLEQLLGQGLSLAEIGRRFGRHEATVGYWVEKHGLKLEGAVASAATVATCVRCTSIISSHHRSGTKSTPRG